MELEKSWASAMHQDHSDISNHQNDSTSSSISHQRRQRFRPMWRVREHMAFLIRNFQFYIQVVYCRNFSMTSLFSLLLKYFPVLQGGWYYLRYSRSFDYHLTVISTFFFSKRLAAWGPSSSQFTNCTPPTFVDLVYSVLMWQFHGPEYNNSFDNNYAM